MTIINERKERADGLVMVTHLEVARDFPDYFSEKEFRQKVRTGEISKGQAVHFNLEQKTYNIIPKEIFSRT